MNRDFYEADAVIHEVVEARRSQICMNLIKRLKSDNRKLNCVVKILDIGCGDGSFIRKFRSDSEVFGIDISQQAVKRAKDNGVNAYRLNVSKEKMPFHNRCFDIVYMGDVIEHLVNPDFAVREVKRVLKSDGHLVISTPNLASWYNRLLLLVGFQPVFSEVSTAKVFGRSGNLPVGHLRIFTEKSLKEFLRYYGFEILQLRGASFEALPRISKIIDRFFQVIPQLSSILIVVAKIRSKS